ncbi:MAG: phosphatidylserine/phosphatidylglycerophosphate/cardiolipin synthase family protein, partial [Planctomycetota bacterium]
AERRGRWVTTRQRLDPLGGLVAVIPGPDDLFVPRGREGLYKLAPGGGRARGVSVLGGALGVARERLWRPAESPGGNVIELLIDGEQFFPALRRDLAAARSSIDLQTFIFSDDVTGRSVARLLARKAREGVAVRVLVDALHGVLSAPLRAELRAAGVELVVQHRWGESVAGSLRNIGHTLLDGVGALFGRRPPLRERRGLWNHDHRKIVIVDRRIGYCGGMNLGHEYEFLWHDAQARVRGPAVARLEALFSERWRAAGGPTLVLPELPPGSEPGSLPGPARVDVVETLPGVRHDIRRRYEQAIASARRRIWIECAYVLDDRILAGLRRRARDGLDVALIVPDDEVHDVPVVRDAFRYIQNEVVRSGVRLHKYGGRMVHAKVAAFDERLATVGSSNLDRIALDELAEANLFVEDDRFAGDLRRRVFLRDFRRARRVGVERLGWWDRLKSGVLHFFRGLL